MSFICDNCERGFTTKYGLNSHVTHNACKTYTHHCKYCEKGFTTETSMYRHVRLSCAVKKKDDEDKNTIYEKLVELQQKVLDTEKKFQKENDKLKKRVISMEKSNKKSDKRSRKSSYCTTT